MPANLPPISDNESDAELILQCRNGNQLAYGQIVQRYQSLVCSVAYSRCGDLGISEDLAQEAFIQAWKKLADLSDVNKFKSWICTIVRNLASRSREKSNRNLATGAAQLDSVVEPASAANAPIDRVISAEQEQLVWQAIADIPENYREPMILFYREEQSVARVATALDISQDAVKQRLSRGRKFLQQQLAGTVAATLEKSKPSKAFAGAVLLGLSGTQAKTATAGVAATVAGKTAATSAGISGTSFSAMFLVPLMKLPILAWLIKTSLDESRSARERTLIVQLLIFMLLVVIAISAFVIGMGLSPALIMLLSCIPIWISSNWIGKRIEQIRIEENTVTSYRSIVSEVGGQEQQGSVTSLFLGSGMLVAFWPALMSIYATEWISVGLLLVSAIGVSLIGARFCGSRPVRSFRVYALSLASISMIGVAVLYFRQFAWSDSLSNHTYWFIGATQAMIMTHVILTTIVWKRVFGKPE